MPTPHNNAKEGDFAKTVLMPGDPLRAKFIAKTYLTDVKQVNSVRNMLGFTGYYNGKKVSVMGSGMGMPSISIYAEELYKFYDVDRIIRIGSAGAYDEDLDLFDLVLAQGASANTSFVDLPKGTYSAICSYSVLKEAVDACEKKGAHYKVGQVLSSVSFYHEDIMPWKELGILAVEMEAYALYAIAAKYKKEALAILSISDNLLKHTETTSKERETGFTSMMEVALECIKE